MGAVPAQRSAVRGIAAFLTLGVVVWTAGTFHSFTWQAATSVLLAGIVMAVAALSEPRTPPMAPAELRPRGVTYWLICTFAFFEWEVAAAVDGAAGNHPTLSQLLDPVLDTHPGRSAAYLLWLYAGWGLVRR